MIVPVHKVQIVALKEAKDALLKSLQRVGEIMLITPKENDASYIDSLAEEQLAERATRSLALLKKYQEKTGKTRIEITYDDFIKDNPEHEALLEQIEDCTRKLEESRQELLALKEKQASYLPWEALDIALDQLDAPKTAVLRLGLIPEGQVEHVIDLFNNTGNVLELLGKSDRQQAFVYALLKEDVSAIESELKNLGLTEVALPIIAKKPVEVLEEISRQSASLTTTIQESEEMLQELAKEQSKLKLMIDKAMSDTTLKQAQVTDTQATVFLEGWVRSDRKDRLIQAIEAITDVYDLAEIEPDLGEQVPTVTKNNQFVDSFETITDMFEKPHPDEVDPNPVMSIWYWLIFGMMMGDVGYGVVMVVLFALMIKKMRPKGNALRLFRVLMYSGVSTILWGILFGSYFGVSWNPILMSPMEKPLDMLILSIVIGACHIISGLLVKAYRNFRDKQYLAIFVDQFSWIFILIGVGLFFLPWGKSIGLWLAIGGAGLIVLFAGRKNKNVLARIGSGLYSLYGITGYLGDILSYARILALMLSSSVIAMVMNMLAGMLQSNAIGFILSLFVYLIGHVFNLAMGMLSAYIHDSRLQYIEFFNKFYEGGGIPFRPLTLQTSYVEMIHDSYQEN
ncbi:MAG: V-type ATP synthase subunit I [Candidatus Izemoplasmatales bacterium]|jgi:V/A-type H+-transporting ATPase subunit I